MSELQRFDTYRLGKVRRGAGGIARIPARLARTGVQVYQENGRAVREYRPPNVVLADDRLDALRGAPITIGHPVGPAGQRMVDPSTFKGTAVGMVSDRVEREDGKFITADLMVGDGDALDRIDRGDLREISVGYHVTVDNKPGTSPEGERYDRAVTSWEPNHVALIRGGEARGGSELVMRLDSNGHQEPGDAAGDEEIHVMKSIRIDGIDYPLGTPAEQDAAARAMERYEAKVVAERTDSTTKLNDSAARLDAVTKERDTAQGALIGATAKLATVEKALEEANSPARLDSLVLARTELVTGAQRVLGAEYKAEGKTDKQIRIDAVTKAHPTVRLDGKSDDFIAALFEVATQGGATVTAPRNDSLAHAQTTIAAALTTPRNDAVPDERAAAERSRAANADRWKPPAERTSNAAAGR